MFCIQGTQDFEGLEYSDSRHLWLLEVKKKRNQVPKKGSQAWEIISSQI